MLNETSTLDQPTACPQTPAPPAGRKARRSVNLEALAIEKRAGDFQGLPAGVKHPDQLLDTFRAAAPALGVPRAAVELVAHLYGRTQPRDWQKDARPLAWPSNQELMHSLARKPTAIGAAISAAVKLGLVVMKDSPSGKRYGRRDEKGAIVQAQSFGFDLAPLALRYEELRAIAQKHRAEHAARMAARKQVTREREGLFQIIDTASELGVWTQYWEDIAKRAEDTRDLLTPTLPLAETEHVAHCLAKWRLEARAMLEQAVQNRPAGEAEPMRTGDESDSSLPENRELKNTTDPSLKIESESLVTAQQEERSGEGSASPAPAATPARAEEGTPPEAAALIEAKGITPARIAQHCPVLAGMTGPAPTWRDIGEACRIAAAHYEISHRTWYRALGLVGPHTAVLVFALMASRQPEHFTKGPGAWFAATAQQVAAGKIALPNLIASFHGMRERAEKGTAPAAPPERQPRKAHDRRAVGNLAAGLLARIGRPMH